MPSEAAPTYLAELMRDREVGASHLARQLGVSRVAVHLWASGKERLPGFRADEIARDLELSEEEAALLRAEATKGQVRQTAGPRTFLDWLVRWDASSHLGETYGERVEKVAAIAGVQVSDVVRWLHGEKRVPFEAGARLFSVDSGAWRGLSLQALVDARELGATLTPFEAMSAALHGLELANLKEEEALSWDDAVTRLRDAKAAWDRDPTTPLMYVPFHKFPDASFSYPDFYRDTALRWRRDDVTLPVETDSPST